MSNPEKRLYETIDLTFTVKDVMVIIGKLSMWSATKEEREIGERIKNKLLWIDEVLTPGDTPRNYRH